MNTRFIIRYFIVVLLFSTKNSTAQTLFSFGKNTVSTTEFLRAYNKNNTNNDNKEKSIREYLKLYSNFKLKVKAAYDLKLDTLEQIKYDVKNFRDQIIENYMVDNLSMQALINEAAERSKTDVHVLYYFVPFGKDSNLAKNTAFELSALLNKSNNKEIDYNNFASVNPSVKRYDIGYITTFSVNYNFENIIYNTKIGNASEPIKTVKGWHIFLPINTRPAVGKWNVAQILFALPPNATESNKNKIKSLADSVYLLLKNGLSFEEAANKYSNDRLTNQHGGVVQEFGTGKYKTSYEEKIFAIKNDNDFTVPFETEYGYHIVKRLSHKPVNVELTDLNTLSEIKQKILQDSRKAKMDEAFNKNIEKTTGFQPNQLLNNQLYTIADSIKKNSSSSYFDKKPIAKKTIAAFADGSSIKTTQWIDYLKSFYSNAEYPQIENKELLSNYFKNIVTDKYKEKLEKYNSDFKYQIQEFIDGNLLFEVMDRQVWSKASNEKDALKDFYEKNKQKYKWDSSADVIFFNCPNIELAERASNLLKLTNNWKIVTDSLKEIQTDSARYELSQLSNYIPSNNEKSNLSNIVKNTDGSATFIQYLKFYKPNELRNFNDSKGLVTNDYQLLIEQKWVDILQKKYPIKYNESAIKSISK